MYSLVTKSQDNWRSKKSSELDKLNTSVLFETEDKFGFPEVESSPNFNCTDLLGFHMAKNTLAKNSDKAVHFFLEDYKFEQVWTRPRDFINTFMYYGNIISPTFSIWSNQPYALSVFNMYRSRWCTRFYQEFGINVLVDCRWSDVDSYDYAFSGIKKHSPVIVNTVGTKYLENRRMFVNGFEEMLRRIEPSKLYVYGEYMPVHFDKYFDDVVYYESFWKKQRGKIKKGVK